MRPGKSCGAADVMVLWVGDIILVSSGEDCIDRFIKEKNRGNYIHLILLDYKLGDIFGDSVARKVKEYNEVKIILFSPYELDDALLEELEENDYISTYVEKPIHLTNLIDSSKYDKLD